MRKDRPQQRSAALLITLAFIVLISILIVGFAASMRTDRPAANMYLEKTKASLFAQAGVDTVIASLRQATADTNRNWISQPGQLVAGSPTNDPSTTVDERKVLQVVVPLHSGVAPSTVPADPVLQPCNINVTTLRDPTTSLITDRPDVANPSVHALMQVAWIYVRKDGTRDTSQTPTVSASNPIVGRYAYWTDDESSKVNYNLAWGRTTTPPNTNQMGHPTKISLAALTGLTAPMADAIHNYITDTSYGVNFEHLNHGFFNTPEEAREVDLTLSGVSAALTTNKFEVTHYSDDPDTTFFNQPRIVLTTQATRAGGKPFLDVGVTDVTKLFDPANMSAATYKTTVQKLVAYLQRTDWPMVSGSGSSFQQKYYGSYAAAQQQLRLTQIALNIIDYVRSKESPATVVIPSRGWVDTNAATYGDFNLTDATSTLASKGVNVFLGQSRSPRINEMGAWFQQVASNLYDPRIKAELYLPRNYGITSIDLNAQLYGIIFEWYPSVGLGSSQLITSPTMGFSDPAYSTNVTLSTGVLNAGSYVTVVWRPSPVSPFTQFNTPPYNPRAMGFRCALVQYPTSASMLSHTFTGYYKPDIAPLLAGWTNCAYYMPDNAGVTEANMSSIEADDPRITTYGTNVAGMGDWVQSARNTFGAVNSRYSVGNAAGTVQPQPAAGEPQLDTDTNGNISDASLYMPPPAGQMFTNSDNSVSDNTLGVVTSVGELGYICTGVESTAKRGTNWRTLRLQTSALTNTVVPDWALMDLFTVPSTVSSLATNMATPYGTSYGGRVNLNSLVVPFNMTQTNLARTVPLSAVFLGASNTPTTSVSATLAATLASNVYYRVMAPTNQYTGAYGKQYGYATAYDSPGEMIEAQGIGDQGETGEALIRDIANLVTARGNVFSVYTVGQSLKQTSSGSLSITGEQRLQAMVERYLASTGVVKFRTVYSRNLTP